MNTLRAPAPNGAIGSSAATPATLLSSTATVKRAMLVMEARMPVPLGNKLSLLRGVPL